MGGSVLIAVLTGVQIVAMLFRVGKAGWRAQSSQTGRTFSDTSEISRKNWKNEAYSLRRVTVDSRLGLSKYTTERRTYSSLGPASVRPFRTGRTLTWILAAATEAQEDAFSHVIPLVYREQ